MLLFRVDLLAKATQHPRVLVSILTFFKRLSKTGSRQHIIPL